ncbi:MAG: thioredoxin domain-containing protein [Anaerolineales bacterium]|nr:thioredoxin domain-containing protein [Anaerolineales bacterium]
MEQSRIENRQKRIQKSRKKRQRNFFLIILGFALVFMLMLYVIPRIPAFVNVPERDHPNAFDNAMGDPNAPVILIDFSDYQCVHCKSFYDSIEQQIIQDYVATGKVYYIFRSLGGFMGAESQSASEAAYCAGEQNKYWEFHDTLYANYSSGNDGGYSVDRLKIFAKKIGLDMDAFTSCLENRTYFDRTQDDIQAAQDYGISGTPTFIINDELAFAGLPNYAAFQQKLDEAIFLAGQ